MSVKLRKRIKCLALTLSLVFAVPISSAFAAPLESFNVPVVIRVDTPNLKTLFSPHSGVTVKFIRQSNADDTITAVTNDEGKCNVIMTEGIYQIEFSRQDLLMRTIPQAYITAGKAVTDLDEPLTLWPGDLVQDQAINLTDIMAIAKRFLKVQGEEGYDRYCDLNCDGAINMSDVMCAVRYFNKTSDHYYPYIPGFLTPTPASPTHTLSPTPTPTSVYTTPPLEASIVTLEAEACTRSRGVVVESSDVSSFDHNDYIIFDKFNLNRWPLDAPVGYKRVIHLKIYVPQFTPSGNNPRIDFVDCLDGDLLARIPLTNPQKDLDGDTYYEGTSGTWFREYHDIAFMGYDLKDSVIDKINMDFNYAKAN